jgi:hypothetical protein
MKDCDSLLLLTEGHQTSVKIVADMPTNISEIMPQMLPANYQDITPFSPKAGISVRRYRPLTHYVSGW